MAVTRISRSGRHGTSNFVADMSGKFNQYLDGWDGFFYIDAR